MLDGGGDQVPAPGGLERLGGAADGEVVALGAAGREDHFGGLGAQQSRHLRPRLVQRRLGLLPEMVDARGVAPDARGGPRSMRSATAGATGVVALWSR